MKPNPKAQGMVLPIVLMLGAVMTLATLAAVAATLVETRTLMAEAEHRRAFHAADGALAVGASRIVKRVWPLPPCEVGVEPDRKHLRRSFEGDHPKASPVWPRWPGSVQAQQILVECRVPSRQSPLTEVLITARGFGRTRAAQAWAQRVIVFDADKVVADRWREITAP
jgi:hypothetical protein